ncbi:MAG: hypothetical protein ABIV21_09605 [Pyrinomonadaceae bacterium]
MKTYLLFSLTLCVFAFNSSPAVAQASGPPKIFLIVREEIKTGMMGPHSREANNVVQIYAKANSPHHRLAMVPVAGNENEVMYFWGYDTFAEMEKSNAYLDNLSVTYKADFDRNRHEGEDYHVSQRDSIAVLREDLSYRPGADIGHMRYLRVQTIRVKPGHQADFEEARKIINAAHEKVKIDENMAVYQMVGGAQSGTYLVLIPWKSLDGLGTIPHGRAYRDAMGESNQNKLDKLSNDSILVDDVAIYAFNPQLSYLSPQMVAADPAFWTLKPMPPMMPAPTTKKMGKKP